MLEVKKVKVSNQGFRNYVAVDENGKDVEASRSYSAHAAAAKYNSIQKESK